MLLSEYKIHHFLPGEEVERSPLGPKVPAASSLLQKDAETYLQWTHFVDGELFQIRNILDQFTFGQFHFL